MPRCLGPWTCCDSATCLIGKSESQFGILALKTQKSCFAFRLIFLLRVGNTSLLEIRSDLLPIKNVESGEKNECLFKLLYLCEYLEFEAQI